MRLVRHTQLVAIVVAAIGALACLAGYGFLPWAYAKDDPVTYSDIGEAARDYGFKDKVFTEAYFAWMGWAVLLAVLVVVLLLALGKKPTGVNPRVLRPLLAAGTIAAVLAHLYAVSDLDGDFAIGAYAVGLGLVLAALATLLPLRSSARMLMAAPVRG